MIKEMVIPLSLSDGLLLFIFSHINSVNNLSFNMIFFFLEVLVCLCASAEIIQNYVHLILGIFFKDLEKK